MLATHVDAEQRYEKLRQESLLAAKNVLLTKNPTLDLTGFNEKAKLAYYASKWEDSPRRQVFWEWFEAYSSFRYRYPKRLELAIWKDGKLAGLALGRPTYGATGLRIDFGERSPVYVGRLSVFHISVTVALVYAELIGAKEIRCMNPVNERVRRYYVSYGFTYIPKGDYCVAKLGQI